MNLGSFSRSAGARGARRKGFSLVEVAMAIGIMAFCILAIVAMLPVGLSNIRRANEQVVAANALRTLGGGFLECVTTTNSAGTVTQNAGTMTNVIWTPGGANASLRTNLSAGAFAGTNGVDPGLSVAIDVTPPAAQSFAPGQARIRLATPAGAQWNGSRWTNVQSTYDGVVYFRAP